MSRMPVGGPSGPASAHHKLLFSLVARGSVVLAEHSSVGGNAGLIAVRILEKLGTEDTRVSYSQERHMFHVMVQDGLTYLCMAEESTGRRIPFAFLEDVRARFTAQYGPAKDAVAYEYSTEFGPVLADRMNFYSSDPQADTLTRVKGELVEVKNIMIENIEKVLERGEKLDLLVDKTDALQDTALNFRRESRRLRRTLWWRSMRMWGVLAAALLLLLYFITAIACGPTFSSCHS